MRRTTLYTSIWIQKQYFYSNLVELTGDVDREMGDDDDNHVIVCPCMYHLKIPSYKDLGGNSCTCIICLLSQTFLANLSEYMTLTSDMKDVLITKKKTKKVL